MVPIAVPDFCKYDWPRNLKYLEVRTSFEKSNIVVALLLLTFSSSNVLFNASSPSLWGILVYSDFTSHVTSYICLL